MNNEWFVIKNLVDFINSSRELVFKNFGSADQNPTDILSDLSITDQEELDKVLSYAESISIAKSFMKKQKNKKTLETRFIINEDSYLSILTALNDRLVSNLLNELVNKGMVETAFDAEANDFIFWIKDDNKQDIKNKLQQPETD